MLLKSSIKRLFKETAKERLIFDSSGRALLYESKWTPRGIYTFTGLIGISTLTNLYSSLGENYPEFFNPLTQLSVDFMSTLGIFALVATARLSPRLISKIQVLKNGTQAEVTYFQVFKAVPPKIFPVDRLKNIAYDRFNFHKMNLDGSKPDYIYMYANGIDSTSLNYKFLTELTNFKRDEDKPELDTKSK